MKILYGVQGTGQGHISRARALLPPLSERAEVDVLLSGYACKVDLDGRVTYRKRGVSLMYDQQGRVSMVKTAKGLRLVRFLNDVQSLPLDEYDMVISDFEPVTAWAARYAGKACVGLSHQAAFLSAQTPRPDESSVVAEQIMRHFAPCSQAVGFHFERYDSFIEPPIIRPEIAGLNPRPGGHVTVYLPAYDYQTLRSIFLKVRSVRWHVFSPYCREKQLRDNVMIHPVDYEAFLKSIETSYGVIAGAGFTTCAEALYMGKKLLAIPIANQYEQRCNAAALDAMGVTTLTGLHEATPALLTNWLETAPEIQLTDKANPEDIVGRILSREKTMYGVG